MFCFIFLTLKTTHIPALLISNLQQAYTRCSDTRKKQQQQNQNKNTHTHPESLEKGEQTGLFHTEYDSFLAIQKKNKQTHKHETTQPGIILLMNFIIYLQGKG